MIRLNLDFLWIRSAIISGLGIEMELEEQQNGTGRASNKDSNSVGLFLSLYLVIMEYDLIPFYYILCLFLYFRIRIHAISAIDTPTRKCGAVRIWTGVSGSQSP